MDCLLIKIHVYVLLVGSLLVKIIKSIAMNTEFANNDYAKPLKVQSSAKGQLMT